MEGSLWRGIKSSGRGIDTYCQNPLLQTVGRHLASDALRMLKGLSKTHYQHPLDVERLEQKYPLTQTLKTLEGCGHCLLLPLALRLLGYPGNQCHLSMILKVFRC